MAVSVQNFTRRSLSSERCVFSAVAAAVLPHWDISVVFVGSARARALNRELRGKKYTPNVLSYALGNRGGEVIICPSEADTQAARYGMSEKAFLLYLFIHGVLHIKGWAHGGRMEKCEQDLLARFAKGRSYANPHETTHRHRHRHRHLPGKGRRRRGTHR